MTNSTSIPTRAAVARATSLRMRLVAAALAAALASLMSGCASMNQKEKGAVIGAATGAAAGAVIGNQMDQQAKEIEQNVPGATVSRVGEGIAVTFESGLLYDYDSDAVKAT